MRSHVLGEVAARGSKGVANKAKVRVSSSQFDVTLIY